MECFHHIRPGPIDARFVHLTPNNSSDMIRKTQHRSIQEMPVSMFETVNVQYQTLFHPYQKWRPEPNHY